MLETDAMFLYGMKSILILMVSFDRSHVWVCRRRAHLGFYCFLTLIRCADENTDGTRFQEDGAVCGHVSCSCEVKRQVPTENWLNYIHVFVEQEKSDLPKQLSLSET